MPLNDTVLYLLLKDVATISFSRGGILRPKSSAVSVRRFGIDWY